MITPSRLVLAPAIAALFLWGCSAYPLPKVYVLGDPPPSPPGVSSDVGLPVFELRTVSVPDYLDTTDILRRGGPNRVIASPTGRWGDRVSVGVTEALSSALSKRLPGVVIQSGSAYEPPRRILVDIVRFEVGPDGQCVLAARWGITTEGRKTQPWSEQGTFVETAKAPTDAAAASAMTSAVDQLADHIAVTIQQALTAGARGAPPGP